MQTHEYGITPSVLTGYTSVRTLFFLNKHKFTNSILIKSLITCCLFLFNHILFSQTTLVAAWDFQTSSGTVVSANPNTPTRFVANVGAGNLYLDGSNGSSLWTAATELNAFAGTVVNANNGLSTATSTPACLALLGGTNGSANGKSIVFKFNMTNLSNLELTYATQKTASGFSTQVWEYSTNGSSWTLLSTIASISTSFSIQTLSAITGLDNAATAYLRLTVTGATTASGNNRLDNIQLNATLGATNSPFLSASPSSLSNLNYIVGSNISIAKKYILSGANLTENIMVNAPTNFEISNTSASSGFSNSLSISPTGGTLNMPIYVRLTTGLPTNAYTGSLVHTGGGISSPLSINLSGAVSEPVPITKISAIQGNGTTAALTGVQSIQGIVTRTFLSSAKLNGFFVQEEDTDSDGDMLTSEGIFVYDPAGFFAGNEGDKVQITGTVVEYVSGVSSLTELNNLTSVIVLSTNNPLPAVSNVQLPTVNPTDLERYEGMLVNMSASSGNLVVTESYLLGQYGQVILSAIDASNQSGTDARLDQYTQFNKPSVGGYSSYMAAIANRKIYLDDGSTTAYPDPIIFGRGGNPLSASNTLREGDEVTNITAVMDHRSEGYRLQTSTGVNFLPTNERISTPSVSGRLKAGSFNVLNYFNGPSFPTARGADNALEFARQRRKTIQAIIQSGVDVLGLNELEDDGYDASSAIQDLVNGLNAVAGTNSYAFINPGDISTDLITVGMIYKPSKVTPTGIAAAIPVTFGTGAFSLVGRRSLAQTFIEISTGHNFTLVANHFKSKGSSAGGAGDADLNDGQGFSNGTRTRQAQDLLAWLATKPTGSNDTDYLLVGDFNAYAEEDPIGVIVNGGFASVLPNTTYSYVFDGQVGALDHAMANPSLFLQVAGATKWHINSDEPNVLDYNTENKTAGQISNLYAADAFRSSDHDPIIIGLNLSNSVPVELIYFTAINVDSKAKLNWATATEINSSYFDIEKSIDGKKFDKIDRVKAIGNTASIQNYEFIDEKPEQGINYYRLKMVDRDPSMFQYSKIASVFVSRTDMKTPLKIYPNPSSNSLFVEPFEHFKSLSIYNLQGIRFIQSYQIQTDISKLNTGIYIVEIENTEGYVSRIKFSKM